MYGRISRSHWFLLSCSVRHEGRHGPLAVTEKRSDCRHNCRHHHRISCILHFLLLLRFLIPSSQKVFDAIMLDYDVVSNAASFTFFDLCAFI